MQQLLILPVERRVHQSRGNEPLPDPPQVFFRCRPDGRPELAVLPVQKGDLAQHPVFLSLSAGRVAGVLGEAVGLENTIKLHALRLV